MRMKILDNLLKGRKMQKAQVWHFGPSLGTEQPGGAIMRLTFWEQPKLFYSHLIFSEQCLGSADMILCSKSNTSPMRTRFNVYSIFPSWDWKYKKCYKFIFLCEQPVALTPVIIGCSVTLVDFDAGWFVQFCPKFLIFGPFLRGRFISPLQ